MLDLLLSSLPFALALGHKTRFLKKLQPRRKEHFVKENDKECLLVIKDV